MQPCPDWRFPLDRPLHQAGLLYLYGTAAAAIKAAPPTLRSLGRRACAPTPAQNRPAGRVWVNPKSPVGPRLGRAGYVGPSAKLVPLPRRLRPYANAPVRLPGHARPCAPHSVPKSARPAAFGQCPKSSGRSLWDRAGRVGPALFPPVALGGCVASGLGA